MRQRFMIFFFVVALTQGGWGGVLASALCPHASGASAAGEHDCCRTEKTEDVAAASCPMSARKKDGGHAANTDSHAPVAESHASNAGTHASNTDSHAAHDNLHVTSAGKHAAGGNSHATRDNSRAAKADKHASQHSSGRDRAGKARPRAATGNDSARVLASRLCAHCVGQTQPGPAAFKLRGPDGSRRGDDYDTRATRAEKSDAHAQTSFVPAPIPTQGAPPGHAARRHVLISVFLI